MTSLRLLIKRWSHLKDAPMTPATGWVTSKSLSFGQTLSCSLHDSGYEIVKCEMECWDRFFRKISVSYTNCPWKSKKQDKKRAKTLQKKRFYRHWHWNSVDGVPHLQNSVDGVPHLQNSVNGAPHLQNSVDGVPHLQNSVNGAHHLQNEGKHCCNI